MNRIIAYALLRPPQITVNDRMISSQAESTAESFLQDIYKQLELAYPKFHKMDTLCKMGLVATEFMLRELRGWEQMDRSKVALVFANRSSSLQTDRQHVKSIADKNNYFPSPSVFVYTLSNIVIGEIAIRHKITGENAFFISDGFDASLLRDYTDLLLAETPTDCVIAGWVEPEGNPGEAFVYCVKKDKFGALADGLNLNHNSASVQQLYNKKI